MKSPNVSGKTTSRPCLFGSVAVPSAGRLTSSLGRYAVRERERQSTRSLTVDEFSPSAICTT